MTHPSETDNQTEQLLSKSAPTWVVHFFVTLAILIIAIMVIGAMFASKPEARKFGSRPTPSVAVETSQLQATQYDVWIDSYGTAKALTQTQLVSDVSGRVVSVSPSIRAGSSFKQGEVLLQLDDRDYRIEVDVAKASVADAEVKYMQELAQADIAERDWNVRPGNAKGKALALRKPQVAAAKASLDAAKARLAKAQLNLERTQIRAPFDGRVMRQTVDLGQVVNPSQTIAEIYSTEAVEVRLPIKMSDLSHLSLPEDDRYQGENPRVVFEGEVGNKTYQWQGELVRSEGAFDTATRMLYVVATIDNPFQNTAQRPAIRVGQFLRAKVQGQRLTNVFVIPRRAVSQDYFVSIAQEGVLKKRKVEPLWTDAESVVVPASFNLDNIASTPSNPALEPSDRLILTPTANLPDGTRVKFIGDVSETQQAANSNEQDEKARSAKGSANKTKDSPANRTNASN